MVHSLNLCNSKVTIFFCDGSSYYKSSLFVRVLKNISANIYDNLRKMQLNDLCLTSARSHTWNLIVASFEKITYKHSTFQYHLRLLCRVWEGTRI